MTVESEDGVGGGRAEWGADLWRGVCGWWGERGRSRGVGGRDEGACTAVMGGRRSGWVVGGEGEGVGCAVVPVCGEYDGSDGGFIGGEVVGEVDGESAWVNLEPWRRMGKAGLGSIYWRGFGVFGGVISWSLQRVYGFIQSIITLHLQCRSQVENEQQQQQQRGPTGRWAGWS